MSSVSAALTEDEYPSSLAQTRLGNLSNTPMLGIGDCNYYP
jgi:hypothetical protein